MSTRTATWLAGSVWGLCVVLVALRLVLQYVNDPSSFLGNLFKVLSLAFATVGALVAWRRPENPVGWIFGAGALLLALSDFAQQYAVYALVTKPGALSGGIVMGWIRLWAGSLSFYFIFAFTLLLFPSGRLLSQRWRSVMWLAVAVAGMLAVTAALQPGPFSFIPSIHNPLGIEGTMGVYPWVQGIVSAFVLAVVGVSAISVILRFRRAQGEERQQIKWIAYAAALLILYVIVGVLIEMLAPQYLPAVELAEAPVFVALPVAIGIAILKYRLYNIDLIINRTMVYVPLTAILAGLYSASITLSQRLFIALTGEKSDTPIVLTTLVVTSAFTPIKTGLQTLVDKRFKEAPEPARKLKAYREHVRAVIRVLDVAQSTRQLLDEAVDAFSARCGAVYLGEAGQERLLHTAGEWNGEARLSVPLESEGTRYGLVSLGARRNGLDYTPQDRVTLQQTADVVAHAIALRGA